MSTSVADQGEPGAAGEAGPGPAGAGPKWLRSRPSRLALISGVVVAVAAALAGVLTATITPARALPAAKNFDLAELGHPGQRVSLAALAGKPVLINFFASWCAPCKRETPLLARFYSDHHGKVLVIGIDSNDETPAAEKFVAAEGVTYPVGTDPFPALTANAYGIAALPQTYFLNARHQIVRHVSGAVTAQELDSWAATVTRSP